MKSFKKHGYEFEKDSDPEGTSRVGVYIHLRGKSHLIGYFRPESEEDPLESLEDYFNHFGKNLTYEDVQEVIEYHLYKE